MRLSQRVKKNMMKKNTGEYAVKVEGSMDNDIQLKSHDQELIFEADNDNDEPEETKDIDDMTIDIGGGKETDASVLQQDQTIVPTQNTTLLTIGQDQAD